MPQSAAPQELDALLAEKQKNLDDARRVDVPGASLRIGTGAAGGFITGIGATVAATIGVGLKGLNNFFRKNKDFLQRLEKGPITPEAEKELSDKMIREMEDVVLHDNGLMARMVRNPGGWVAGLAVGGGALGALWQMQHEKGKVKAAKQEVNALERIKGSWTERASAPDAEEKSADCHCHSK